MKYFQITIFLLACIFLIACSKPSSNTVDTGSSLSYSNVVITLSMGGCHADCPAYRVTISGDGTVTYQGFSEVKVMGERTTSILMFMGIVIVQTGGTSFSDSIDFFGIFFSRFQVT